MLPFIALALQLLPFVSKVPEVVEALKGGRAAEAAVKVLEVAQAVTRESDPNSAVATIKNDPVLQGKLQELLSAERIKFAELALEETKVLVEDTSDARHTFAQDRGVYRLGVVVLATFATVAGLCIYGAFRLLLDDDLKSVDVGVVAAVFGFLGTVVGYVAANAQQVISYFFGSSRGSADRGRDMAEAFKGLAKRGTP